MIYTIITYQFEFYIVQYTFNPSFSSSMNLSIEFGFHSRISDNTWTKTINVNDLRKCFSSLSLLYPSTAPFPYQDFIQIKSKAIAIEIYLIEVCKYIRETLSLPYVFNSQAVIDLFALTNISNEIPHMTKQEIASSQLSNCNYNVSALLYLKECNVLLVAGNKAESILDSLMLYSTQLGQLIVYQYMASSHAYKNKFIQQFECAITKMAFDIEYNYLTLCFSNGVISIYDFTNCVLKLIASIDLKCNSSICFTMIDYDNGYLYSAFLNEPYVIISDIREQAIINAMRISNKCVSSLIRIPKRDLIIASEESGELILFKISNTLQLNIMTIENTSIDYNMKLIGIEKAYSDKEEYLAFVGNEDAMEMYTIKSTSALDKKLQLPLSKMSEPIKVVYDYNRPLLIIGFKNGTIQVYSRYYSYPVYSFKLSFDSIGSMMYDKKGGALYLYTNKDDIISITNIPTIFNSDICYYDNNIINEYIILDALEEINSISSISKAFMREADDSFLSKDNQQQQKEMEMEMESEEEKEGNCSTSCIKSNDQTINCISVIQRNRI